MLTLSPRATMNRVDRGLKIFNAGLVRELGNGTFAVKSEADNGYYIVSATGCTCPDGQQRNILCKHAWAAFAAAALTIWRLQMATTRLEVEQLAGCVSDHWPEGIKRTVMMEAFKAIERVSA